MFGAVEVLAGVPGAAALLVVHADGDEAVEVAVAGGGGRGGQALGRRVREAAVRLGALTRATLELSAHLLVLGTWGREAREEEREREKDISGCEKSKKSKRGN